MTIVTLNDRQEDREIESSQLGIERYRKNTRKRDIGDRKEGTRLMLKRKETWGGMQKENIVEHVSDQIQAMIDRVEQGKAGAGRPALAVSYLVNLQPEVVAYITVRTVLQAACRNDKLTAVCMRISRALEDQYRFDELMSAEPALGRSAELKAKKWTTGRHRSAIMRQAANVASVRGMSWAEGDMLKLGGKLIDVFLDNWKVVENGQKNSWVMITEERVSGVKTVKRLKAHAHLIEWIERNEKSLGLLRPRHMPMVVAPKPWTSLISGGYQTKFAQSPMIRGISYELRDDLMSLDIDKVYDAVNNSQATGWCINESVRSVMQEAWDSASQLGGMPPVSDLEIPTRPADIDRDMRITDMSDDQVARFRAWSQEAAKMYEYNAQITGRRLSLLTQLHMSKELRDEEVFWFPHSVDFRGRLYSIVPELNPQADDFGRSLLRFSDGKELGSSGAFWLYVHVANLFGVDKCSFDERVEWTTDHMDGLIDSAHNPLDGKRMWCSADDPWQTLAACFELAELADSEVPEEYVTHLPIAMDGSCSGLQHFSAMLLDEEGALAVNLTDSDKPSDIYTQVQLKVEELLLQENDNLAYAWRSKVTRKIVKRPCMTFAYSVTSRGMRDQIVDELRKEFGEGYLPGFDNWEAGTYLAPIVEKAIRLTVKRAAEAMDWLRDSVRLLIKSGRPVTWSTPLGFVVQQTYQQSVAKKFNVWFQGRRTRLMLRVKGKKADARKQASAVAPNFVHSLDACHLQMVVNRMVDEGVTTSFSVIHDSFGVHACDVDELHYVIRDEFVKLYSVNQLEKFRNWMLSTLPEADREKVLPVPEAGTFDIEEVRRANYFFA